MQVTSLEIKLRVSDHQKMEAYLKAKNALYIGEDHQIDTYFKVSSGRLKLREGNIENTLIRYHRKEQLGIKKSEVLLYKPSENIHGLKSILSDIHPVLCTVDKKRKIYFLENVKFHLDEVKNLGRFIEIEALSNPGNKPQEELRAQCEYYLKAFGIDQKEGIDQSYSQLMHSMSIQHAS